MTDFKKAESAFEQRNFLQWCSFSIFNRLLNSATALFSSPLLLHMFVWFTTEMSTDRTGSEWIRTEANFGGSGLDRTAIFFKIGGSGLDRTVKIFVILM